MVITIKKLFMRCCIAFGSLSLLLTGCSMPTPAKPSVRISSVPIGNGSLNYFTFGTGKRPFVILPGVSVTSVMDAAESVAAAYDCFSNDYTVYLIEPRADLTEAYSVEQMAEDVAATMTALGLADADLMGCSLGGMIAQCLAASYPELVHRMVLASTLARHDEASRAACSAWKQLAKAGNVADLNRSMFSAIYSPAYYEQYRDVFISMEDAGTAADLARFSVLIEACANYDGYDRIREIRCPVLVMGSWDDQIFSGMANVEIAEALHCELFMYHGYGHAVYDEAPDFKERMLAFFHEDFCG